MSLASPPDPAPPPRAPSTSRLVVPFHELTRVELVDAPVGTGDVRIPDAAELRNHLGTVHGGMLFALGEIAAASAMTKLLWLELGRLRAITRRASIDYLKPARGAIRATASVALSLADMTEALTSAPSIDVPISVELHDAAGIKVAELHVVWFVGRPRT